MKKFIQQKLKDQKGMTLIELLAVIVIIAIIAAIAIPAIGTIIENSRHNAARADVQNVLAAGNLYFTENSTATTAALADLAPYLDDSGNVTAASVENISGGNTIEATVVNGQSTYEFPALTNKDLNALTVEDIKLLLQ